MKIGFHTLGCKVNQYETEAVMELFEKRGYEIVDFEDFADIYLINTCTVTNVADKKSRQMLSKARRHNPDGIVIAMGCYAQIAADKLEEKKDIDLIVGTTKKNEVVDLVEAYIRDHSPQNTVEDVTHYDTYEDMWLSKLEDKKRAHIKIQDGCNQFCSYCIIPLTRGRVRSREKNSILSEVKGIVQGGYLEVVLTGIHLASYGLEFDGYSLIDLLEELNGVEGLGRIRLGSLEPTLITEDFVKRLKAIDKLCPHFHLSLQSGCDETLKRMNRKYTTEHFRNAVLRLRGIYDRPSITTDIIVGFPGENQVEFESTMAFVKEISFSDIHVFKYSKREGTKAANMKEQVAEDIKNVRSKILSDLRDQLHSSYVESFIAQPLEVLFEETIVENGINYQVGHTPNYIRVLVQEVGENLENSAVFVMPEGRLGEGLIGKLIKI